MFGNFEKKKDDKKDKKKEEKAPDFSEIDKKDVSQSLPDTVTIHPAVKDLVERVIRMRRAAR